MPGMLHGRNCSEIGLAELLKVMVVLKPKSNDTKAFMAESLGFSWRAISVFEFSKNSGDEVTPELKVPTESFDSEFQADSHGKILAPVGRENQRFEILLDDPILASTEPLEPTNIESHMVRPRYQPLLHDIRFRGIMGAMLATSRASKDIEWTVLERELVRGLLLKRLPLRQRPTLQRGVLLILDRSESMQPFWRDEKKLLRRLQRVLGGSKVRVWWMEVDRWLPDGPQIKWYSDHPHKFPEKTPLLIVSDFGIDGEISGSCTGFDQWRSLLNLAERYCCPQVALIPAPESYWPNELKQLIPYSYVWDRDTSITTVRRRRQ